MVLTLLPTLFPLPPPHFFPSKKILEAVTMQHIFMNNFQLCSEINERVVQHFVHCIETHGRNVQYIKFLQTIVKAEGKFIKKCQDMVMAEVRRMCLHKVSNRIAFVANRITEKLLAWQVLLLSSLALQSRSNSNWYNLSTVDGFNGIYDMAFLKHCFITKTASIYPCFINGPIKKL